MLEIMSYVVEYKVGFIPDQLEKAVEAERIQGFAIFTQKRPIPTFVSKSSSH